MKSTAVITASLLLLLSLAGTTFAQQSPDLLDKIGLDQKLNSQVPLDLEFVDESGQTVKLADYFGKKPVILTLVYYECPMLCTLILNGTVRALRTLDFSAGKEFEVVTVSINPKETPELATKKKNQYLDSYRREGAEKGWHFLTGREDQIRPLAEAVGYRYAYDPETGQYAHASGIMVLTPEGKVARYFYGVEYSGRDLRLGLIEASQEKIGSPVDQVLLYCYHYNPLTGKYSFAIMSVLRAAGALTVLAIAGMLFFFIRRDKRVASARA